MAKEGYKPTSGMQAAARRAIKWKEDGKATGAGTAVGWTRAGQLARGETLSLSTVKRMYSFFSRHEVDKKGKDFHNTSNPSNGRIMWDAWGGDAGFSWSRKIVQKEKNVSKSFINEDSIAEELSDIIDDILNPITDIIEIEDDEIVKMDGQTDLEVERQNEIYKSDNEDEDKWDNQLQKCWVGYKQIGMKEKGGKMVPNCVPVEKSQHVEEVKKSLWTGRLDPISFAKRKFNAEQRRRMAESGNAMPDGSYPIANRKDLMNAIRSWGRGGSDPKVKSHIKRRAKELGAEDMIPENWK